MQHIDTLTVHLKKIVPLSSNGLLLFCQVLEMPWGFVQKFSKDEQVMLCRLFLQLCTSPIREVSTTTLEKISSSSDLSPHRSMQSQVKH